LTAAKTQWRKSSLANKEKAVRGDLKLYFIWRFENVLLIVCIFFPKLYFLL